MTKKKIEETLKRLKLDDVVKIKTKSNERLFMVYRGKNKFWHGSNDYWRYSSNGYLYWENAGDMPQSVYFQKIDIAAIQVLDPYSFVNFLHEFLRLSKKDEFINFIFS